MSDTTVLKSETRLQVEATIKIIEKARDALGAFCIENYGADIKAPEAALRSLWYLNNLAYYNSCSIKFNRVVKDCYDVGGLFKQSLANFTNEYLEFFFPRISSTPRELGLCDSQYDWRKKDESLWYNRPLIDGRIVPELSRYQTFRRFVVVSTGFIYGDAASDYSSLLRPVFEAIVELDRTCIHSSKAANLLSKSARSRGLDQIDKFWIKDVLGHSSFGRLGQAISIPEDIFRHIYTMVPPFPSVLLQTDEFQLYKTTFQICAYDAVDWIEERKQHPDTIGEEILKNSCVFEL